jgi:hypothetical protein
MKIVRNIKRIRIDWLKVAAALSAGNPYGPMIGPDGTVYSFDGSVLAPGSETAAATTSKLSPAAGAPASRNPRPVATVRINRIVPA